MHIWVAFSTDGDRRASMEHSCEPYNPIACHYSLHQLCEIPNLRAPKYKILRYRLHEHIKPVGAGCVCPQTVV